MDQIIPRLFIARTDESERWKGRVINLSEKNIKQKNVSNLPIDNTSPDRKIFLEAVEKAVREIENGNEVTLVCRQGVSRSVSVGIGAIVEEESFSLEKAFRQMELEHPETNPSENMLRLLKSLYGSRDRESR